MLVNGLHRERFRALRSHANPCVPGACADSRTATGTKIRLVFLVVLRALLLAWAGFWAWFVLAVLYGGAEAPPPWWIPVLGLSALAALVLLAWKLPTAGGVALLTAGVALAVFFAHPASRALLAGPAVLLGLGFLALRWREILDKRAPPARHSTE